MLNLICEVKARLDGKVDSLSFPIPQFIVIGKQSVGKSRLIEANQGPNPSETQMFIDPNRF